MHRAQRIRLWSFWWQVRCVLWGAFVSETLNGAASTPARRGLFGGVMKAQLARAAALQLPDDRRLRSMSTTFVAPGGPGVVELRANVVRTGKGMSFVSAEAWQDSRLITIANLAFASSRPGSLSKPSAPMPAVPPPPEQNKPIELEHLAPEMFREQVDKAWVGDHPVISGVDEPKIRLWFRFSRPVIQRDGGWVSAMLDVPPPPLWCALEHPARCASVTTHLQLVRDPASLPGAHPWFLYESTASHMGDGHSDIQARLWHEDGGLCGTITQHVADFSSVPHSHPAA